MAAENRTTLADEIAHMLPEANRTASLMRCRFVLSERKLRWAGADDELIAKLRQTYEMRHE